MAPLALLCLLPARPPAAPPPCAKEGECASKECNGLGIRYGTYCGVGHTGCAGVKPCDSYDACCQRHDECVGVESIVSVDCHSELSRCLTAALDAGEKSFLDPSSDEDAKCKPEIIVQSMSAGMQAAGGEHVLDVQGRRREGHRAGRRGRAREERRDERQTARAARREERDAEGAATMKAMRAARMKAMGAAGEDTARFDTKHTIPPPVHSDKVEEAKSRRGGLQKMHDKNHKYVEMHLDRMGEKAAAKARSLKSLQGELEEKVAGLQAEVQQLKKDAVRQAAMADADAAGDPSNSKRKQTALELEVAGLEDEPDATDTTQALIKAKEIEIRETQAKIAIKQKEIKRALRRDRKNISGLRDEL